MNIADLTIKKHKLVAREIDMISRRENLESQLEEVETKLTLIDEEAEQLHHSILAVCYELDHTIERTKTVNDCFQKMTYCIEQYEQAVKALEDM